MFRKWDGIKMISAVTGSGYIVVGFRVSVGIKIIRVRVLFGIAIINVRV